MTFGERLKYALDLRKKKQAQLCEATGLSSTLVSMYVNDKCEAKSDKAYIIAEYLDINELWLMGLSDDIERKHHDEDIYKKTGLDYFRIPLYSPICCGNGGFNDDNILEYVPVPSKGLSDSSNYFCQRAIGESMKDAGINNDDLLVFEKVVSVDIGVIGCFCVDENVAMCKKFNIVNNIIMLMPMNSDFEPVIIDPVNSSFKCLGKLKKVIKEF